MSAIPSWARVGAKVVCVATWRRQTEYHEQGPVSGEIYTIREVGALHLHEPGVVCVRLVEIKNRCLKYRDMPAGWEPAFRLSRFRPLITIEDDIATHFRQHLDVREPVEA